MSFSRNLIVLIIAIGWIVPTADANAQPIDQVKLDAARKAAYEKFIPAQLRDGKAPQPIDMKNAAVGPIRTSWNLASMPISRA